VPYLSASAVVIHYEEALYQVYGPFTLPLHTHTKLITVSAPPCYVVGDVMKLLVCSAVL